jgi:hypothetical protein
MELLPWISLNPHPGCTRTILICASKVVANGTDFAVGAVTAARKLLKV